MAAVTSNKDTWTNMVSKLKAMGGASNAVLGEPTKGIQSGLVAVIPESMRIDETTLNNPREIHVVTLRRYENRTQAGDNGAGALEERLDQWRANIERDIFGDFDLGGTVAYALPLEFQAQYGYQTVENLLFRILDLTVAYRVDDRAAFAA